MNPDTMKRLMAVRAMMPQNGGQVGRFANNLFGMAAQQQAQNAAGQQSMINEGVGQEYLQGIGRTPTIPQARAAGSMMTGQSAAQQDPVMQMLAAQGVNPGIMGLLQISRQMTPPTYGNRTLTEEQKAKVKKKPESPSGASKDKSKDWVNEWYDPRFDDESYSG
jgi:hypothetical protein